MSTGIQNGQIRGLFDGTGATDGITKEQLDAAAAAQVAMQLDTRHRAAGFVGGGYSGVFVDGKVAATTTIDTTDATGFGFYPRLIIFSVGEATGLAPLLTLLSVSIGWTSPNYADLGTYTTLELPH